MINLEKKVIRSMTDANRLLKMGNKLIEIDRDVNNRKYLIFIFEKTEKIMADLDYITNNK